MIADILTRSLGPQVFYALLDLLLGMSPQRTGVDEDRIRTSLHGWHRDRAEAVRLEDVQREQLDTPEEEDGVN